ncbi:MAG: UMP kinase [Bacilli bacterium]|nr:UMP kinase [Bacilli bacterium]MDY6362843.1 UMP kinase [Bacilli bacterium]
MYKRILIKLSGEALAGDKSNGILDPEALLNISKVIKEIAQTGTEVCVVIGAGNICRGSLVEKSGIERVTGDKMGMLGTVINSFALANTLQNNQQNAVVLSAVPMETFTPTFSKELADKYLKEKTVVVFGGGTGKPFFTTDTCATLRAIEVGCDAILIAKNGVDGIYSDDPRVNKDAYMFKEITCSEIIAKNLKVMDITAVEMLKDQNIDVRVFNMQNPDNFLKVVRKEDVGTTIKRG